MFGQKNEKDNRKQLSLGLAYTLPLLFVLQGEFYNDGNIRLQLKREDIPISKRIRAGVMFNTDKEYMLGFNYIAAKNFGFRTHYDSDMGFGIGFAVNY